MQNNKVLAIIFSYNRAAQLDALLRSILQYFKFTSYEIAVVYLTTREHALSYVALRDKYAAYEYFGFYEVQDRSLFSESIYTIPFLFIPINTYWWVKHPFSRNIKHDFKAVTEMVMRQSNADFAMFITDDTVFYRDVNIPSEAAGLIKKHPLTYSFRCYVGKNIDGCPDCQYEGDQVLSWSYYGNDVKGHWAYPFSVDSTIYSRRIILSFSRILLYNLPSTLEAFGVSLAKHFKLFRKGLSPMYSTHVNLVLNRVQDIVQNETLNVDTTALRKYFEAGYELHYVLPDNVNQTPCRSARAVMRRGNEEIQIC